MAPFLHHQFKQLQGELPRWLRWVCGNKENKKSFYRILLVIDELLTPDGYALPHEKLARECGATKTTIGKWLKDAEKRNLLSLTAEYIPKIAARRYKAVGRLAEEIRQRLKS